MKAGITILPVHGEVAARRADGGGSGQLAKLKRRKSSLRKRTVDEARKLRRTMTLPEVLLWRELRGEKLGVPFRKQHPVGLYKADFYCGPCKLVVEVDGFVHDRLDQARQDVRRDHWLRQKGCTVLRIAASDVLRDMEAVLENIRVAVTPLHRFAVPLPVNGEDV